MPTHTETPKPASGECKEPSSDQMAYCKEPSSNPMASKCSEQAGTDGNKAAVKPNNAPPSDACSNQKLMDGLSKVLAQWASQESDREKLTCFHCLRPPNMSMAMYAQRLRTYFFCSDTCFLVGLMYIDRIIKTHPEIQVCDLSCHRLFAVALLVAVKFNEDTYYSNAYYAKVSGLRLQEVNKLEKYFLGLLDWKLIVQPEEYSIYFDLLTAAVDGCQAKVQEQSN